MSMAIHAAAPDLLRFLMGKPSGDAQQVGRAARYAETLGLDVDRFRAHLHRRAGAARIAEDVDSADLSGVSGTPTFFINGRRHHGGYDIAALSAAVRAAHARAATTA